MTETRFSILDLVPVREGHDMRDALANAAAQAQWAEQLGFHRYWVAEHHGMPGIGGAATSVVLAHLGHATSTIRIGAGGIMLPNHSPLQIAEQFGTLDALFPGRIDLGLGRAPGSDGRVAQAMRRNLHSDANEFPRDVLELQAYFEGNPQLGMTATPGSGAQIDMWILGSSLFGAQLAAALGLPFAFASHFAPDMLDEALAIYREQFRPSKTLAAPYAAAAYNCFAADSMAEATLIASSMQQSFVSLRTGSPGKLPPPVVDYAENLDAMGKQLLRSMLRCVSIGTQTDIERDLGAFIARTGVTEVVLCGSVFDQAARRRSLELVAAAARNLGNLRAAA
jgi:luciferase family oxidoreductase group 1